MQGSTPKERLLAFIESKKISVRTFESNANLGNAFVDGVGHSIRKTTIEKIKKAYPDFDETWIISGVKKDAGPDYKALYEHLSKAIDDYFSSHDALRKLLESQKQFLGTSGAGVDDSEEDREIFYMPGKTDDTDNS